MNFVVKGVDKNTGKDRVLKISAPNQTVAELQAGRLGLLVEQVRVVEKTFQAPGTAPAVPAPAQTEYGEDSQMLSESDLTTDPVVDDALANLAQSVATTTRRPPNYDGILKGANQLKADAESLRSSANTLFALAVVLVMLGMGIPAYVIYAKAGNAGEVAFAGLVFGIGAAFPVFLLGRVLLYRATMSVLNAELALAQRDVAINSFRA
jgi:hypothetical protein